MKISYNWLEKYVELGQSPDVLSDMLTMAGLEVEEVLNTGPDLSGVVVGNVLEVRAHPNADRLWVCVVDLGADEPAQIVCGAPNVAAGQRVPVAVVGTTLHLPDRNHPGERVPVTIKKAKIRGERSTGMICAEDELGLSNDHSGIMVLGESATVGEPFVDYLQAQGSRVADAVIDIAITPNRQDAISHIGIARDVAALTEKELRIPETAVPEAGGQVTAEANVEIRSPEGCGRYSAILVKDLVIGESPEWLKNSLEAVGLRSINNVVDITNYVMYECGQPLHAFDFDILAGGSIVVEATSEPTTFKTLDGQERKLPAGTLMICDAKRPVAIAGVMGGENSEVRPNTKNVLIESAFFDPASIRRTAKHLMLQTDASYRFERGVDSENTAWAASRAADLMCSIAGGSRVDGMIDERPMAPFDRQLLLRKARIGAVLGVEVAKAQVEHLLTAIGFELTYDADAESWTCRVPSYRQDVEREIGLIEEVARLYGYDNLPEPKRGSISFKMPRRQRTEYWRERTLGMLGGLGFREIYTNSLLPDDWAGRFSPAGPEVVVGTLNSVSQGMTTLRPALLPGALKVVAHNQKHGRQSTRFVEFGHVFEKSEHHSTLIRGYAEHEHILLVLSGTLAPTAFDGANRVADVFDIKGSVETLCAHLGIDLVTFKESQPHPETEYTLDVVVRGETVGSVGKLASGTQDELGLRYPVYYAEMRWERLTGSGYVSNAVTYQPISRFPIVERDLALVVNTSTGAGELVSAINRVGGRLLQETIIFDIYEGDQLDTGKKSIAFKLRFGASRTLVDKEVDAQIDRILGALKKSHEAELR